MAKGKAAHRTAPTEPRPKCPKFPAQEMLASGPLLEADRWEVEFAKMDEIISLLFFPKGTDETKANVRITRALELYDSLAPKDAAEGLLAEQMVGTHFAALECLRRAALPDQTFAGRDMALKHANRLMTLYTQQLAALDKHRGKGQQKVTVEHVHVHSGGQAIVGSVERRASPAAPEPPALGHAPEQPLDLDMRASPEPLRGTTD